MAASSLPRPYADRYRDLLAVCWEQWRTERELRARGIDFRSTDAAEVRAAYSAMSGEEFAAINGRHAWANARTLRKSLAGLVSDEPLFAIDLGCGIGTSTQILATLLPPGSRIVGIEFAGSLADVASRQTYQHSEGTAAEVEFSVGSVAETWRLANGDALEAKSVDLVNASGVLGHHLGPAEVGQTLDELVHVVKPMGIAALDVGPTLSVERLTSEMQQRGFQALRRVKGQPFDRTGQVVFRRGH